MVLIRIIIKSLDNFLQQSLDVDILHSFDQLQQVIESEYPAIFPPGRHFVNFYALHISNDQPMVGNIPQLLSSMQDLNRLVLDHTSTISQYYPNPTEFKYHFYVVGMFFFHYRNRSLICIQLAQVSMTIPFHIT